MRVTLEQVGTAAFEATGGSGGTLILDGAPDIGGEGRGMRPMELLLTSLASCAAMDVLHILRRQREPIEHLRIEVHGVRPDGTPSPFSRIHMVFIVLGAVAPNKLQRATQLSVEKYCSVTASLDPRIQVTWEARLESDAP
jgi:putative redox protein